LIETMRREGRRLIDLPLYRLLSLDCSQGKAKLEFAIDHFFNYLCSTGALERELYQALIDNDLSVKQVLTDVRRSLPLRHRFVPDAASLVNFSGRMCAGGPHVLMAFRRGPQDGNDYVFFARRRAAAVATGDRLMTLIPMGYHQPTSGASSRVELPIATTVFREAYEELFGGKEVEGESMRSVPLWYLTEYHPLAWFKANPSAFTLQIVSVGIGSMLCNYEIAVLFAIHDPRFWNQFSHTMQLNWEVEDTETPLISTANPDQLRSLITQNTWVGSSLFALIECLGQLSHVAEGKTVHFPDCRAVLS